MRGSARRPSCGCRACFEVGGAHLQKVHATTTADAMTVPAMPWTPDVVQPVQAVPVSQQTAWLPSTTDWCRWVFMMLDDADHFLVGKVISGFILLTILLSTTTFILESMPSFQYRPALCDALLFAGKPITKKACEPVPDESFFYLEIVCICIFTVEYLARLLTCHAEPSLGSTPLSRMLRYARRPLNIIDVLAVAPFYLGFLLGNSVSSLRVLRLFRVVRLFKLAKHHGGSMQNEGNVTHLMSFLRHPALFRSYSQQWVYFGDLDVFQRHRGPFLCMCDLLHRGAAVLSGRRVYPAYGGCLQQHCSSSASFWCFRSSRCTG
eukprot:g10041.t1